MAGCMSLEAELTWVHRDQGEDLWDLFTSNNFQMIPDPATGPQPRTRTAATWLAANYFSRIISKYFCPHEGRAAPSDYFVCTAAHFIVIEFQVFVRLLSSFLHRTFVSVDCESSVVNTNPILQTDLSNLPVVFKC